MTTPTVPAAGPDPARPALPLCDASALVERGPAVRFDVMRWGETVPAFAMRFDGRVVAYVNRCVHVPTEMDWQPGRFLDSDQRFILCSIHGAAYEPADGRCVGGPCGRGRLTPVDVAEVDGKVCWYPSRDIRPVPASEAPPPAR